MFRKFVEADKQIYIEMSKDFYNSAAVKHSVPTENFENTFAELISGNPCIDGYIFEYKGEIAGYSLLSLTYSNEAGGNVLLLEEIYVLPEFQGKGIGKKFFSFIEETFGYKVKRIRLEVDKENKQAISLYKKMGYEELDYLQMFQDKE